MTGPQEQFAELKGVGSRSRSAGDTPGNPEEVLDAVFDFAENLIAQQRNFAKQMLRAAERGRPGTLVNNGCGIWGWSVLRTGRPPCATCSCASSVGCDHGEHGRPG
jgi:hypothetical protein